MAVVIGTAGGSARRQAWVGRLGLPMMTVLVSLFVGGAIYTASKQPPALGVLLVAGILVEVAFFGWKDRADYIEAWDDLRSSASYMRGAEGERRVGEVLSQLPDEYVVFHDFRPTDGNGGLRPWNVDHIVVGPSGVFVVETKMYSHSRVLPSEIDQNTRRNVRQVTRSAIELKDKLRIWSGGALSNVFVEAVLVYAQDKAFVEKTREGATQVIPLAFLLKDVLQRSKRELTQEQVYRVARAMTPLLRESDRYGYSDELARLDRLYAFAKTSTATPAAETSVVPTDCPLCGAPLTRKVAKRGKRAGKPFLGCSLWGSTQCSYIFNLDD